MKYEAVRNEVVLARRADIRAAVSAAVATLGGPDMNALRKLTGIATPALYRALSELGYMVPTEDEN